MFRLLLLFIFSSMLAQPALATDQIITVNFTTATLTMKDHYGQVLLETAVVLPRGDFYQVPVTGTVYRAEMGPTWVPTANMHSRYPGRYKSSYGPYETGNAMGYCKLSINFNSSNPIMRLIRIHGNGQPEDLGRRLSSGCIRIPDSLCSRLVGEVSHNETTIVFTR